MAHITQALVRIRNSSQCESKRPNVSHTFRQIDANSTLQRTGPLCLPIRNTSDWRKSNLGDRRYATVTLVGSPIGDLPGCCTVKRNVTLSVCRYVTISFLNSPAERKRSYSVSEHNSPIPTCNHPISRVVPPTHHNVLTTHPD